MYKSWMAIGVLCSVLLAGSTVRADGLVQSASKEVAKGAVNGAQQAINSGEVTKGAKQITKGMVDGLADEAPLLTSQIANQANVNKKVIGKVVRQISTDAIGGAFGATVHEVNEALGKEGDGPLATAMIATTERVMAAAVRGMVTGGKESDIRVGDNMVTRTEQIAAAAVRGATSEMHFSVWPYLLVFALGSLCSVLSGAAFLFLYMLFQRRHPVAEAAKAPAGGGSLVARPTAVVMT